VRTLFNTVLIAFVSAALIGAPVMAAPAPGSSPAAPLGIVVQANSAKQGVDVNYSGATVYDGDRLQTPEGSTLRVQVGAEQVVLRSNSAAQLHAMPNGFSANLNSGSIIVSSAAGQTFELYADGATITPANAEPVSGQITMLTPKELVLTSNRGVLKVTMGDEVKTLEPGSSYRMEVESADAAPDPGPNPQSPSPTARNRFIWIAIPAIAAVTAIVVWRALVSPSSN
jgi:hypothetical protein